MLSSQHYNFVAPKCQALWDEGGGKAESGWEDRSVSKRVDFAGEKFEKEPVLDTAAFTVINL